MFMVFSVGMFQDQDSVKSCLKVPRLPFALLIGGVHRGG